MFARRRQIVSDTLSGFLPKSLCDLLGYDDYYFEGKKGKTYKGKSLMALPYGGFIIDQRDNIIMKPLSNNHFAYSDGFGSIEIKLNLSSERTPHTIKMFSNEVKNVYCMGVLSDDRLVTSSFEIGLRVWNTETGKCESRLNHEDFWYEKCIGVLKDDRIISESHDHNLKVQNVQTGKCEMILRGHRDWITCIEVLPDNRVVTGSRDRTIKVWDIENGVCQMTLVEHTKTVGCVGVLPNGLIISGSIDCTVKVWNLKTEKCEMTIDINRPVLYLIVLTDGRVVTRTYSGSGMGNKIIVFS